MKLLMIDNYDSFTFNLVQYFGELGAQVEVVRNDETGWLVAGKPQTTLACRFAARLGDLLGQPDRLPPAGAAGAAFVRQQRSLASAATILRDTLAPLLTERNAP